MGTPEQLEEPEFIPFEIVVQGAPRVSYDRAVIWAKADNILCLDIELGSKHCELAGEGGGDGYSEVYIDECENTIHPEEGPGGEGMTGIRFHTLKGWDIYNTSVCRYTLRVTLVREEDQ